MKFQNIFFFAMTASLALAKHHKEELSDNEDNAIQSDNEEVAKGHAEITETKKPVNYTVEKSSDGLTAEELEKAVGEASDNYSENEYSDDYYNNYYHPEATTYWGWDYPTDYIEDPSASATVDDYDVEAQAEGNSNLGQYAAVASAALISSAGIFLWAKRSKKSEVENGPLNMA